jgi:hypothetical protein
MDEVKVRNEKVVYKKKIRKMGLENTRNDTQHVTISSVSTPFFTFLHQIHLPTLEAQHTQTRM